MLAFFNDRYPGLYGRRHILNYIASLLKVAFLYSILWLLYAILALDGIFESSHLGYFQDSFLSFLCYITLVGFMLQFPKKYGVLVVKFALWGVCRFLRSFSLRTNQRTKKNWWSQFPKINELNPYKFVNHRLIGGSLIQTVKLAFCTAREHSKLITNSAKMAKGREMSDSNRGDESQRLSSKIIFV